MKRTFTFGKYKGEPIEKIIVDDPSYVDWASRNVAGFKLTEAEEFLLYYADDWDMEIDADLRYDI